MPQTRFVLRKALELNKKVIVVVNKIDRASARRAPAPQESVSICIFPLELRPAGSGPHVQRSGAHAAAACSPASAFRASCAAACLRGAVRRQGGHACEMPGSACAGRTL